MRVLAQTLIYKPKNRIYATQKKCCGLMYNCCDWFFDLKVPEYMLMHKISPFRALCKLFESRVFQYTFLFYNWFPWSENGVVYYWFLGRKTTVKVFDWIYFVEVRFYRWNFISYSINKKKTIFAYLGCHFERSERVSVLFFHLNFLFLYMFKRQAGLRIGVASWALF